MTNTRNNFFYELPYLREAAKKKSSTSGRANKLYKIKQIKQIINFDTFEHSASLSLNFF